MFLLQTSESFNDTDEFASFELFYRHSSTISIIYCIAYFLVFTVGLVGNCFVIAVVSIAFGIQIELILFIGIIFVKKIDDCDANILFEIV